MSQLLEVRNLSVSFTRYRHRLDRELVVALEDASLTADRGEVLAIIGESGAGKSILAASLLGILPANAKISGQMLLEGQAFEPSNVRGKQIALIPQSISYLDPMASIGSQLGWAARRAGGTIDLAAVLDRFSLQMNVSRMYPHELSGGMARRVLVAMATAGAPRLIIADEPTTGLDPENNQISLDWLRKLADAGTTVLLITHDLAAALQVANRVAVFREGSVVSLEQARDFTGDGGGLTTDYARALWRALPANGFEVEAA